MKKDPKITLIGGTAALVAAIAAFIGRFVLSSEMARIKSSAASVVISGSKQMSRSDYIQSTTKTITTCTLSAVVLLILAAALFAMYYMKKKKVEN